MKLFKYFNLNNKNINGKCLMQFSCSIPYNFNGISPGLDYQKCR
jgi:hypothetical protein